MQGNSPPHIHMHFTILDVNKKDSDSTTSNAPLGVLPKDANSAALDSQESSPEEKKEFDDWLLKRWRQKDAMMNQFYKNGDFIDGEYKNYQAGNKKRFVEIPLELKYTKDFFDMFLWGGPILLLYLIYKLFRW